MKLRAVNLIDFYKSGHIFQYPKDTKFVYANFTPRSDKWADGIVLKDFDHKVVWFGARGIAKWLLRDLWNETFFSQPKHEVLAHYKRRMDSSLGEGAIPVEHIAALHDLGYLPVKVKALKEGFRVNMRVPVMTIINTDPKFFWLTNYLETQLSNAL